MNICLRNFMLFFVIILPCLASASSLSVQLDITDSLARLELAQTETIRLFVKDTLKLLPPKVSNSISEKIVIKFAKLDQTDRILPINCTGKSDQPRSGLHTFKQIYAERKVGLVTNSSEIRLNQHFIPIILAGAPEKDEYDCNHRSNFRLAQATLLHEILHAYDTPAAADGAVVSERDEFAAVMNFKRGAFIDKPRNAYQVRTPDNYELWNLKEAFTVNSEYFLLHPDFACRKPSVYNYLASIFEYKPFAKSCRENHTVFVNTDGDFKRAAVDLDPGRVFQIHYLVADRGRESMSKWGHAMYRIILCAPERKNVGPECLKDVRQHLVLSFRANVSSLRVNISDGLTGKYPSQLFILRFPDVMTEYSIEENRPLLSYPLELSKGERERFIHRTLEQYWAYKGKYYFVTNNCASEALHLIAGATLDQKLINNGLSIVTPFRLLKKLMESDRISTDQAPELYDSLYSKAEKGFQMLKKWKIISEDIEMKDYVNLLGAERRRVFLENLSNTDPQLRAQITSLLALEKLISNRLDRAIEAAIRAAVEKKTLKASNLDDVKDSVERFKKILFSLDPTGGLVSTGYGIPLFHEAPLTADITQKENQLREVISELRQISIDTNSDLFKEQIKTKSNIQLLLERLRTGIQVT